VEGRGREEKLVPHFWIKATPQVPNNKQIAGKKNSHNARERQIK